MKYMGSKARIAKYILPIILKDRKEGQWYVEPFCGGCNTLDKVTGKRIGCDSNEYLIAMFKALQDGWEPPKEVSEEMYNEIRDNKYYYRPEVVCFVGFNATFASKWFGGYARPRKNGYDRDVICGYNAVMKQKPLLDSVRFFHMNYQDLKLKEPCVIYCDPPYAGTTKYKDGAFNHDEFWEWCRMRAKEGHQVFISEYNAPPDFECVWEMPISNTLAKDGSGKSGVERLFRYRENFNNI